MFEGIRNDGHVEFSLFHVKDGQADAVEADGAFFYDQGGEFFREFQPELPASSQFLAFQAGGGGINVSLDDVAVEASVHEQASFQVDEITFFPGLQSSLLEGLFDGGDAVHAVFHLFYGEADPVMGDALVDFKLLGEGGFNPIGFVRTVGFYGVDPAE